MLCRSQGEDGSMCALKSCVRSLGGLAFIALAASAAAQPAPRNITPEATLRSTPDTVVWGYITADVPAALQIRSGQTVKIDTVSHQGLLGKEDPATFFATAGIPHEQVLQDAIDIHAKVTRVKGLSAHVLTGPVYVEGAEPGDMLEVRILKLDLRVPYGVNNSGPRTGVLPDLLAAPAPKIIKLDTTRNVAGRVELDDLRRRCGEQIGQHAGARTGIVDAVGHAQIELEDAHLQHVAGLGALDIDWAGEHVRAQAFDARHLGVDVDSILHRLVVRDAGGREERRRILLSEQALVRDRVDLHGLPRPDLQRRRQVGGDIAPDHRVRRRSQGGLWRDVTGRRLRGGGCGKGDEREPAQWADARLEGTHETVLPLRTAQHAEEYRSAQDERRAAAAPAITVPAFSSVAPRCAGATR